MNPETPMTPREETEVRLTALLMGELPPDEAAALHAQMAADPALAALHARLRQAMELLREATALPEQPAPPVPAQLSSDRRERLLAHFKNPAPAQSRVIVQPRRDWSWAVPLGLAAALIALLGGTVLMSGFSVKVLKGFAEEPPDFASADYLAAEAAPQSTHWSMQPGATRTYGEADARPQLAGIGGEKSDRYAFVPPPPAAPVGGPAPSAVPPPPAAPATAWASQPGALRTYDKAQQSDYAFKLYSSDAMTVVTDAAAPAPVFSATTITAGKTSLAASPAPVPALPRITIASGAAVSEPYLLSEPLSIAGKIVLPQSIAPPKFADADPGYGNRGFAQQADGLARNKAVGGIVSGASGTTTFSGTLSTNGNVELSALATTDAGIVAQGVNPTRTFARAKSAPDVAFETLDFAKAQTRPTADLDADSSIMLGDARMKARGETAGGDEFFSELNAPASRPEIAAAVDAPAKPGAENLLGEKLLTGLGADGEARKTVKLAESKNEFGLPGTDAYRSGTTASGGTVAKADQANALGWYEKSDDLGLSLPEQPMPARGFVANGGELLNKEEARAQYRRRPAVTPPPAGAPPAASEPVTAFAVDGNGTLDVSRALGIDPKLSPKNVEFEGFVNNGSPIQPMGASDGGIANSDFIVLPVAPDGKRLAGVVVERDGTARHDFGTIEDKKTNPVGGRIAFWSDDESSKLNINTATEGTVWDTPVQTRGDIYLGRKAQMETPKVPPSEPAISGKGDRKEQESEVRLRRLYESVDELAVVAKPELKNAIEDLSDEAMPGAKPVEVAKLEELQKRVAVKDSDERAPAASKPAEPAPVPQPEIATSTNAFSTFSLNVSDVAFKLAAASLEQGKMPEPATVRSEEFINAFDYRDPEPAPGVPLAFVSERARYPFAQNRDLLRFSVKTAAAGRQPGRPLNIVLLLDNSGSMERADRVNIIHEALRVLAAQLQPQDKLSIVTFARTPRLWADGVAGDKAGEVTARVGEITPQGGTDIAAALDLGYATALRHFQVGSINRVVMLTDGAANLGDVNPDALKQKVEAHRKQGVALDCFGIGWEGYDDTLLEALARNGDGRYGFINTPEEAATGFAAQLAGALRVAASDVKVQVEWNPRRVTTYRQIGYAKHQLKKEQFRDNTVDAAEIGAAESGNALYVCEVNPRGEGDLATVRVRFKVSGTSDYREHEWTVPFTKDAPPLEHASPALRLAGTASAFSEWLTASPYASEVTPDRLLGLLNGVPAIYGADPRPQKLEWMIRTAKSVSGR